MRFQGRTAIVTGAGQGIGRALTQALAAQGMRVAVVDIDPVQAQNAASCVGGVAIACDMTDPDQIRQMVVQAEDALGGIDLVISNAGVALGGIDGPATASDAQWQQGWDLHVMAHLRVARAVLPAMIKRGEGWLVNVASAAGLLSQIGDAPYSASKHAAVSLAQSLAIEHGHQGIKASVVCPLYVATPLLGYDEEDGARSERVISAEDVALSVLQGLRENRFLILPHPEVATHVSRRAADMDRWIAGMQRLRARVFADGRPTDLSELHRRI